MQTEWNGRAEVRITRLRVCIIRGEQQWMKRKRPRWDWEKGETLSPSLKSVTNFPTAGKKLAREAYTERSLSFVVFHHLHTGCRFQSPWRGEAGAPEQV